MATSLKSLVFGRLAGRRVRATIVWSLHDRISADYFPWFLVPLMRYVAPWLVDGIIVNSHATRETIRPGRTPVLVATPADRARPPRRSTPRGTRPPRRHAREVVPVEGTGPVPSRVRGGVRRRSAEAYIVGGALFGEDDYQQELGCRPSGWASPIGCSSSVTSTTRGRGWWTRTCWCTARGSPSPSGGWSCRACGRDVRSWPRVPADPEEIITHGVDGLLVECGSEEGMISALRVLRDQPATGRALADRGHETARQFEASVVAPPVHRFLEDVHRQRLGLPAAHPVDGLPYPTDHSPEEHS